MSPSAKRVGFAYVICIGMVSVVFLVMGIRWIGQTDQQDLEAKRAPTVQMDALHPEWVAQISAIRERLKGSVSASALDRAELDLIALKVTASDRETHLALLFALRSWKGGDGSAQKRFSEMEVK